MRPEIVICYPTSRKYLSEYIYVPVFQLTRKENGTIRNTYKFNYGTSAHILIDRQHNCTIS